MDVITLGIVKNMPDTAVLKSGTASARAEQAEEYVAKHAQEIDINGISLIITEKEGG